MALPGRGQKETVIEFIPETKLSAKEFHDLSPTEHAVHRELARMFEETGYLASKSDLASRFWQKFKVDCFCNFTQSSFQLDRRDSANTLLSPTGRDIPSCYAHSE